MLRRDLVVATQRQRIVIRFSQLAPQHFGRQSEGLFHTVNRRQVIQQDGRVERRLAPTLSLVVAEQEEAIANDRPSERCAELVLPELIEVFRSEQISSVQRVIPQVVIDGAVKRICSRFGHDIHNGAGCGPSSAP